MPPAARPRRSRSTENDAPWAVCEHCGSPKHASEDCPEQVRRKAKKGARKTQDLSAQPRPEKNPNFVHRKSCHCAYCQHPDTIKEKRLEKQRRLCGAHKADGGRCKAKAGAGTAHPGVGKCKHHGGNTKAHILSAAKAELGELVGEEVLMGLEYDISPVDALMWCIKITSGEVRWLSDRLAEAKKDEWLEDTIMGKQLNIWAQQRIQAVARLAKYSKMGIDANLGERAVRMSEQYGQTLYQVLKYVLDNLKLTPAQREEAPAIVRQALMIAQVPNSLQAPENGAPPKTLPNELPVIAGSVAE